MPASLAATIPGQHVAGLGDAGIAEEALERALGERADVSDDDRDRRKRGKRGLPVAHGRAQRHLEEAREHGESSRLGRHRHERRDRGRGALIDVRRPLVEGRDRELEREPGCRERDADQDQRVVGQAGADALADAVEVGRAGAAVDEREAVEERGRAEASDDQVLEARIRARSGAGAPSRRGRRGAPTGARARRRRRPGSAPSRGSPCPGPMR